MAQAPCLELSNPLGFTNETAALISSLGCTNLKLFKKKDISLDDLQNLTKEDLEALEVGDTFDFESFEKLKNCLKRKYDKGTRPPNIADVIKIFKTTRKQMELVNYHLKYLHLKMKENREDVFIDRDKHMKASEAVVIACDNLLAEIKELRAELASVEKIKQGKRDKENSYVPGNLKGFLGIGAGVILTCFLVYKFL